MTFVAVDKLSGDDTDPLPALQARYDKALADLKRQLTPDAEKHGLDVDRLTELVLFSHNHPDEFERLRAQVAEANSVITARLKRLEAAAERLRSAIEDEADTADPFTLLNARVLLKRAEEKLK